MTNLSRTFKVAAFAAVATIGVSVQGASAFPLNPYANAVQQKLTQQQQNSFVGGFASGVFGGPLIGKSARPDHAGSISGCSPVYRMVKNQYGQYDRVRNVVCY